MKKDKKLKLDIGGCPITVVYTTPGCNKDFTDKEYGCLVPNKRRIYIDKRLCYSEKQFTVLHELIHGCYMALGKKATEEFVISFSHLLWLAMKQLNFKLPK